jgi:hypothetical protein
VGVISVSDFIANLAAKIPFGRRVVSDVSDVYLCCRDKTPIILCCPRYGGYGLALGAGSEC